MANCDQGCNCIVRAGNGVNVSGSGTGANPYVVSLAGSGDNLFVVQDTPTVNLTLSGNGTIENPWSLSAAATVAMTQLSDVNDPQGGPNAGDVPVWVTSGVPHFEFQPPPANPGVVNVGAGLDGDGSVGAPLTVQVIGTSAGGSTSGLEVYVDSAGNLRAVTPAVASVSWASITGKPSTFPGDWNTTINKPSVFPTNDANFSGILSVSKGGTGANNLANITVGNSTKVAGHDVFVQSSTPSGTTNDLWFW